MKIKWLRFQWNLAGALNGRGTMLPPFVFRVAEAGEADDAVRVLSSALSIDSTWEDVNGYYASLMKKRCEEAFQENPPTCVVAQHGSRIIGISAIVVNPDASNHLVTGPILFHEYRNRGIGSCLLFHSLDLLRDLGLKTAFGVTQVHSGAARFVYPKFGGQAETYEDATPVTPQLVA